MLCKCLVFCHSKLTGILQDTSADFQIMTNFFRYDNFDVENYMQYSIPTMNETVQDNTTCQLDTIILTQDSLNASLSLTCQSSKQYSWGTSLLTDIQGNYSLIYLGPAENCRVSNLLSVSVVDYGSGQVLVSLDIEIICPLWKFVDGYMMTPISIILPEW